MKIFAKIRFGWGAFVIGAIVGLLMIPLVYIFPKHKGIIMHKLNRVILFLIGADIKKVGDRDERANLFIMNHQGIIDIITMEAIENVHWRWVAKKELFDMPLYGYLLKGGDMISVDRENKAGLRKLIGDVQESITQKNRAVAIFPEGTRSADQTLLQFKSGTKLVAQKLDMRVQPIVILGSKWVLNEHDQTAHSGTVKVIYLEAFDVKDEPKNWYEQVQKTMQEKIDQEYAQHGIER